MFKREYLVSFDWQSKHNGNGTGHITFTSHGKIKSDDIGAIIGEIDNYLKRDKKDNNDYFSIVILNIVRL